MKFRGSVGPHQRQPHRRPLSTPPHYFPWERVGDAARGLHLYKGTASTLGTVVELSVPPRAGITRKEISREILVMNAELRPLMTGCFGVNYNTHPAFVFLRNSSERLLEPSWRRVLHGVLMRVSSRRAVTLEPPINLSDSNLSTEATTLQTNLQTNLVARARAQQLQKTPRVNTNDSDDVPEQLFPSGNTNTRF